MADSSSETILMSFQADSAIVVVEAVAGADVEHLGEVPEVDEEGPEVAEEGPVQREVKGQ